MKIKTLSVVLTMAFGLTLAADAATSAEATTPEFRLSIKHDGIRASAGEEMLRYSPFWDGGSNETAKVTLKQGDAVLSENLTAEGDYAWSVSANGTYNLTHTTYTNGAVAKVLNATFVVTGKDRPFPPGSVTVSGYNGKYDGNGHGISVTTTDIANPSITYSRTETGPYTETNPLFTNVCNETVWYVVAAPGYITETNSATVVITQGDIGGGGGAEPGPGEIPEGGLSKFDATYVYDGEGHTINTQALFAVTLKGATPSFWFAKDNGGVGHTALPVDVAWSVEAPVYTNVGEYVVWYRITAPNYSNYVHAAKVTITKGTVEVPTVEDIEYTGEWQCADILEDDRYEIDDDGGVHAGTYNAYLTLADPENWQWKGETKDYVKLQYRILQAKNTWTATPTISGWTYGDPASTPTAAAKFGSLSVVYSGTARDGTVYDKVLSVSKAGDYKAIFDVAGTADYSALHAEVSFAIAPKPLPPPGPGPTPGGGAALYAESYAGIYDADGHAIKVWVTGTDEPFEFAYATEESGPWGANPAFTNVCEKTVWFVATSPNYQTVTNSATVSITAKPILHETVTVMLTPSDFSYTGSACVPTVTVHDGEADANLQTPRDYTFVATDNVMPGTAKVTIVGAGNYAGERIEKFTITQRSIDSKDFTVTLDETSFVYDGTMHEPAVTVMNGAKPLTRGIDFTVSYQANCNAGEGKVVVSGAGVYSGTVTKTFTIAGRPITVTSAGESWVFDTTAHATNGVEVVGVGEKETQGTAGSEGTVVVGLIGDDLLVASGFPSITDVGSKANAFEWAFGAGTLATNYCVSCVTGTLTVTARPIGDDPAKWDIRLGEALTYNGAEQTAPIIQVAFRKPDGNLVDISYAVTGDKGTDADNYSVKISGTGNYSGTVEKEWAIIQRNVMLTSATTNWVYDGVAHTANVVTVTGDGFVDGEGVSFADFPGVRHVSDASTPIENNFTYDWNDGTKAKNYSVKTFFGTVQMSKLPVTVTSKDISKTYDGTPLKLTGSDITVTSGRPSAVSLRLAVPGDQFLPAGGGTVVGGDHLSAPLPAGEQFTYTGLAERTEAGQIDASFTVANGTALVDDYAITKVFGKLTVKKNATEITVTAKSKSWTYDGGEHQLHEYDAPNATSVLLAGDALDVSYDAASVVQTPVDGPKADGVVSNVITNVRVLRDGTEDVTKNYTLSWYPGTLTVTKRPVTLTSKDATKPYDGTALMKHEVTVGGDGFVGADGADYSFTGTQTEKGTSKNTFSYALKSGTNAAYYDITTEEGTLEVTAADITGGGADDLVVTLGPSLTYNGLLQLQTVASVTFKGLVVDCSVTENQQKDAGDYQLTLTGRGNFAGVTNIAWTLLPKALTLTAGDGSKPYDGTPLTVASVGAEGFVSGEGATYVCEGSQLDVGDSANVVSEINWDANTKGTNYAVTKKPGKLTVTPRAVKVTSKSLSKPYDGSPLTLTAADIEVTLPAGESFVYGDFAARTEAGQTNATFSVAAGPNTKLSNYTITPVYGTITITKSATEIGVTAKSQTWTYDGETHTLNKFEATNLETLQKGDELHVEFDTASAVTLATDGPKGDGVVPNVIKVLRVLRNGTQDVTDNYTVTPYPGTLTVTKRPVTVVVGGHSESVTYDGESHSVSGYDISTEDELYDISADTTFSGTDSAKGTDADTYKMGLKPSDFANGNANFAVTYAVTDGKLTISPLDIGAADVTCTITLGANPKYNGTSQFVSIESVTAGRAGSPLPAALPVTYTMTGQNATDAGVYTLTVKGTGNFTGEKSTTWQILKREVTLTSGSASKVYDGTPLTNDKVEVSGDGFAANEGVTYTVTGSQTAAGSSDNAFAYTRKAGTKAENYTVKQVQGKLTVTQATLGGEPGSGVVPAGGVSKYDGIWIFDGNNHTIDTNKLFVAFDASDAGLYTVVYGVTPTGWSAVPPTIRDAGTTSVWYKVTSQNYQDFVHIAQVTIVPKTLTAEMCIADEDAAWFFDGTEKKPAVKVVDGDPNIATSNDYTLAYSGKTGAGLFPVTITGTNNYTGVVTKEFAILKRPVTPPVIPSLSYNKKNQKPTIATDSRWTVVENAGGVDAGEYPVVLKLTNTTDYKWKGYAEDGSDTWTGVFVITKAGNKVNRLPSIASWTNGVQEASVPTMGGSKWGGPAEYVEYRVCGADPLTGVREQPSEPGKYTARFVWPETKNYTACFYDVDFEIFPKPSDPTEEVTTTTPVPVPKSWLAPYVGKFGGDYEATGNATGDNGYKYWQSYVAGLDPTDPDSRFKALISVDTNGKVEISWDPDKSKATPPRVYTTYGKAELNDGDWTLVTEANKSQMKFFKVEVKIGK